MSKRKIVAGPVAVLLGLAFVMCSSPSSPKLKLTGPLQFKILSGNHQEITAGSDSLLSPVIGQAYRENGKVSFHLFATPLDAQTQINTGVPNVLTCASPVGSAGLVAYVTCETTDSLGMVTYWFQPGTVATDSSCAQIRTIQNNQPVVLATTCSQVDPGPVVLFDLAEGRVVNPGDVIHIDSLVFEPRDQYGNVLGIQQLLADTTVKWAWEDGNGPNKCCLPSAPTGSGWTTTVPDPQSLGWSAWNNGTPYVGELWVWLDGVHSGNASGFGIR